MSVGEIEAGISTLVGIVGGAFGIVAWRASKRTAKAHLRAQLRDALEVYEAALAPYRERFLSSGPTSRPGDQELIMRHLPALTAARDRLVVLLHRAEPGRFRFCRELAQLEIRRFSASSVGRVVNAVKAARAEVVFGEATSEPRIIPDGKNYEVIAVSSTTMLS